MALSGYRYKALPGPVRVGASRIVTGGLYGAVGAVAVSGSAVYQTVVSVGDVARSSARFALGVKDAFGFINDWLDEPTDSELRKRCAAERKKHGRISTQSMLWATQKVARRAALPGFHLRNPASRYSKLTRSKVSAEEFTGVIRHLKMSDFQRAHVRRVEHMLRLARYREMYGQPGFLGSQSSPISSTVVQLHEAVVAIQRIDQWQAYERRNGIVGTSTRAGAAIVGRMMESALNGAVEYIHFRQAMDDLAPEGFVRRTVRAGRNQLRPVDSRTEPEIDRQAYEAVRRHQRENAGALRAGFVSHPQFIHEVASYQRRVQEHMRNAGLNDRQRRAYVEGLAHTNGLTLGTTSLEAGINDPLTGPEAVADDMESYRSGVDDVRRFEDPAGRRLTDVAQAALVGLAHFYGAELVDSPPGLPIEGRPQIRMHRMSDWITLGFPPGTDLAILQSEYRKLARTTHSDRSLPEEEAAAVAVAEAIAAAAAAAAAETAATSSENLVATTASVAPESVTAEMVVEVHRLRAQAESEWQRATSARELASEAEVIATEAREKSNAEFSRISEAYEAVVGTIRQVDQMVAGEGRDLLRAYDQAAAASQQAYLERSGPRRVFLTIQQAVRDRIDSIRYGSPPLPVNESRPVRVLSGNVPLAISTNPDRAEISSRERPPDVELKHNGDRRPGQEAAERSTHDDPLQRTNEHVEREEVQSARAINTPAEERDSEVEHRRNDQTPRSIEAPSAGTRDQDGGERETEPPREPERDSEADRPATADTARPIEDQQHRGAVEPGEPSAGTFPESRAGLSVSDLAPPEKFLPQLPFAPPDSLDTDLQIEHQRNERSDVEPSSRSVEPSPNPSPRSVELSPRAPDPEPTNESTPPATIGHRRAETDVVRPTVDRLESLPPLDSEIPVADIGERNVALPGRFEGERHRGATDVEVPAAEVGERAGGRPEFGRDAPEAGIERPPVSRSDDALTLDRPTGRSERSPGGLT